MTNPFRDVYLEGLKGKQKKLDVDKDGKIEKTDLEKLRSEEIIVEGDYEKAEENKRSADAAKSQARPFDYHMHMADHHDNMSQWHASKGRHGEAAKHAEKSDEHHEKAMAVKESIELDEAGLKDACWKGYTAVGMKMKNGKKVPNCVPVKEDKDCACEEKAKCGCEKELDEATPYYNKPSFLKRMGAAAKKERLAREKKEREAKEVKEAKYNHDDNRRGFGRREREDDEYHVPDPEVKNKVKKEVKESTVPDHMKGKQKPYVSSDGKGNHEVLGNTGQTKATFTRKEHGAAAKDKAIAHLKKHYDTYMKEEVESIDETRVNGREYASHGLMHPDHAKMDIHKVSGQHVDFYASKTGDKMQGKVVKNDGKSVHIQAHKDKEIGDGKLHKFKVTPHLPKSTNEETTMEFTQEEIQLIEQFIEIAEKLNMSKASMGTVIKDFKASSAPQFAGKSDEKRRQMAIAAKLSAERGGKPRNESVEVSSFAAYNQDGIDEAAWPGTPEYKKKFPETSRGKVGDTKVGAKGTQTVTSTGVKHERDYEKAEKETGSTETQEKRGRGRPKGSKSGAR